MADVEHGAVRLADEIAHAAPTVEGDDQLPALVIDGQLLDAELVGEPDAAVERRDHGLDVAPLLDQAAELVDRDLEIDGLVTRPRRFLGAEAERSVVGPLDREAHVDDPGQQRGAVGRAARPPRSTRPRSSGPRRCRATADELAASSQSAPVLRDCASRPSSSGSASVSSVPCSTRSPRRLGCRFFRVHRPGGPRGLSVGRKRCEPALARFRTAEFGIAAPARPRPASPRPAPTAPRPALDLERGLVHEHPEPVDDRRAAVAGTPQQRGLQRVVDEVGHHLAGVQRVERRPGARRRRPPAMPTGVAFTTNMAAAAARGPVVPRPARAAGRARAAASAASGRRAQTTTWAPARPSARATARAAPPAPSTTTAAPAGS